MVYENLVIRRSKQVKDLYLICNCEKVYRIIKEGKEVFNGLDYDKVSEEFNILQELKEWYG